MTLLLALIEMFARACMAACPSLGLVALVRGQANLTWREAISAAFAGALAAYFVMLAWSLLYVILYMQKAVTPDSILPQHVPFIMAPVVLAAIVAIDEYFRRNIRGK